MKRSKIIVPPGSEFYPWVVAAQSIVDMPPTRLRNDMMHRLERAAWNHSDAKARKRRSAK